MTAGIQRELAAVGIDHLQSLDFPGAGLPSAKKCAGRDGREQRRAQARRSNQGRLDSPVRHLNRAAQLDAASLGSSHWKELVLQLG